MNTRKFLLIACLVPAAFGAICNAEDGRKDPNKLFYAANSLYEKGEYAKSVETYLAIVDAGLENGAIYYNIGNGFFKMGKFGYALLSYEKARRFMPGDSDLKSNLEYVRSFVESRPAPQNSVIKILELPFRNASLSMTAITALALLFALVALSFILVASSIRAKKLAVIFFVFLLLNVYVITVFGIRYYAEEVLNKGMAVEKNAECRYEPIDKAAVYFNIKEGEEVIILKSRNGWKEIKRSDGKVGWVPSGAVQEIK